MNVKRIVVFCAICSICLLAESPWNGSVTVPGNGKFAFRDAVLTLKAGKSYQLSFNIQKNAPLSENTIEHRLVLFAVSDDGKHRELATFADEVPVDNKSHVVKSAFTIPADATGKFKLFAYNCNAEGAMELTNIELTELGNLPEANIGSKAASVASVAVATEAPATSTDCIRPHLGNDRRVYMEGNGRFMYEKETIPAEPGAKYDVSFEMRKAGALSRNPIEHRMVLALERESGGGVEFMYAGEDVPVDGEWHTVNASCTVPTEPGKVTIFIYNVNGEGSLEVRDLKFVKQGAGEVEGIAAPVIVESAIVPVAAETLCPQTFQTACLEGNGRFLYVKETIPAEPGAKYAVSCEMRKTGELSRNPIEHRMVLALEGEGGGVSEFMYAGEDVPVDGEWHTVNASCTIPTQPGKITVFVYNVNAEGNFEIKNLKFVKQ